MQLRIGQPCSTNLNRERQSRLRPQCPSFCFPCYAHLQKFTQRTFSHPPSQSHTDFKLHTRGAWYFTRLRLYPQHREHGNSCDREVCTLWCLQDMLGGVRTFSVPHQTVSGWLHVFPAVAAYGRECGADLMSENVSQVRCTGQGNSVKLLPPLPLHQSRDAAFAALELHNTRQ